MKIESLDLRKTNSFSSSFLDYLDNNDALKPYFGLEPTLENFGEQIKNKQFSSDKRQVLHTSLSAQYEGISLTSQVKNNLEILKDDNTFTVTTGHQLNIFTGPLYFIYKIVTVVNTCKSLKARYPEYNFVPVYWMATEDHDFEEINHFNLFGKRYQWETDQKGAVGRFSTEGLEKILEELPEKIELFSQAYSGINTLTQAVRYYVNELFGHEGIVVVDGDDIELKRQFESVLTDDLFNHTANELVEKTSADLNELGYKTQVFPRAVNLFYLEGNTRERLVREGELFRVNNTEMSFDENQLRALLKSNPERFSPNVVLRPLYQETILPNLAYVGGPSEVVYWLQLKPVFEHYNTAFPILMPRNFALCISKALIKKIEKFELSPEELFHDEQALRKEFVIKNTDQEVSIQDEKETLKSLFDSTTQKANEIDGSLSGFIGAEYNKALKGLENIEKRLKKSEERKHETALNQISALKQKLFPRNNLQERQDNFLNFYINNPNFIGDLLDAFDPFNYQFHILIEE